MRRLGSLLALTAVSLLWTGCSGATPAVTEREDDKPPVLEAEEQSADEDEQPPASWLEREDEPPAELDGAPATKLLYFPYVNSLKYGNLCGEEVSETYPDGAILPHGLTAESELPRALVEFLDQGQEFSLSDYEYRWFEEERIVLFTRTRHGPDHSVVAAVAEVVLLDGDPPAWGIWSAGGRYICME